MDEHDQLTARFEEHRPRLRAMAYRMLGSTSEADDALQDAWIRVSRATGREIDNVAGWLTTVVVRVCLNLQRSRVQRREDSLEVRVPDPVLSPAAGLDPEAEAVLASSVGLALMVVLETLSPAERLAFVLHDMFAVPFEEIASMLERSPAATRQLASRARRRVQDEAPVPDPDLVQQRRVVDAFFAAARDGDLDALVAVLAPDIVLRADGGVTRPGLTVVVHGSAEVAARAATGARFAPFVRPALVNGVAGAVVTAGGRALSIMAFTVVDARIVAIDVLYDTARLAAMELDGLDDDPTDAIGPRQRCDRDGCQGANSRGGRH